MRMIHFSISLSLGLGIALCADTPFAGARVNPGDTITKDEAQKVASLVSPAIGCWSCNRGLCRASASSGRRRTRPRLKSTQHRCGWVKRASCEIAPPGCHSRCSTLTIHRRRSR